MSGILRKWAHTGGTRCAISYTPDGSSLYTIGGDDFVRLFSGEPSANHDEAQMACEYHEQPVLALDCSMESFVTGGEDGQVALFSHGSQDLSKLVTRSTLGLPIRSIKFSPNGQRVAVSSDELIAKVIDVRDTSKMQVLEGHTKSIRAVTWSPDGQLVCTSSSDGTIRVWDVSNTSEQEPGCIHTLEGLIGTEEPESFAQCEAVWHPSGKYFVVGTKSHEIAIVTKATWEREGAYEQEGHTGEIHTLAFSPNGRYLCSSASDGAILVWDTTTRKVILRQTAEGTINSLVWRPGAGSNSISFIEDNGHLSRWDDVIPSDLAHPNDAPQAGSRAAAAAVEKARKEPKDKEKAKTSTTLIDFDDDDLDLAIGGGGRPAADNDEDDDDQDGGGLIDEDDFIEDDEDDAGYRSRRRDSEDIVLPPALGKSSRTAGAVTVASSSSSSLVRGQEPFQPGATPLKEKRRYLAFNMIGVIHIVERESHNIVTVDFHDTSRFSQHHFDDYTKFNLAALGPPGAVYAANSSTTGNTLAFKPFESWTSSSGGDWTISLPTDETVTALAIGGGSTTGMPSDDDVLDGERLDEIAGLGTVVAATSRGFLRFFGASGTQKYIVNFGEQIVAMSAGKEWLLIVHRPHELIKPQHQELSYTILDLETYETLQRGSMPLPKGSTLSWVGFSEDQMPYMYDSTGFLSGLERSRRPGQARWVPMLETATMARRENKTESYWPVGVSGADFVCIILKGEGERYPYFPVPITQNLPLAIPLLEPADAKSVIEINLLQTTLLGGHARDCLPSSSGPASRTAEAQALKARIAAFDVEMDKSVLKLIQLACKAERQQQALDLARTLTTTAGISGAIKIANLYSLAGLVGRFETLLAVREGTYGTSSWRDTLARREGKYAHLVDARVVPDSTVHLGAGSLSPPRQRSAIDGPSHRPVKQKKTAKSVFSAMPEKKAPAPAQSQVSDFQYEDSQMLNGEDAPEDSIAVTEESMQVEDSEPVTYESLESSRREMSEDVPTVVSKPRNPFAKSALPPKASASSLPPSSARAGPSNPFAKTNASHSAGLKKTGSFFNRVDASNGLDASGSTASTSTSGPRQSTLFGSKPKALPEKEKKSNRGRKRKSETTGADEEDNVNVTAVQKKPKSLNSFWKKEPLAGEKARTASPPAVDDGAEQSEAILPDEEPSLEEEANSSESVEVGHSEPVTPYAEVAPEASLSSSPVKNDGMSKLAAFRADAATVITDE